MIIKVGKFVAACITQALPQRSRRLSLQGGRLLGFTFSLNALSMIMKKSNANSSGSRIRFSTADRNQREFRDFCVDELVRENHQVRILWSYVCRLDLSELHAPCKMAECKVGQTPVDPRILLTLWLMAALEGISSGRCLASLCQRDNIYRWICGDVDVSRNLINKFRVSHAVALHGLMSQTIAALQHQGLIPFNRIRYGGGRVRTSASDSNLRINPTLDELVQEAEKIVERVLEAGDGDSICQAAARRRAAEERRRRLDEALKAHDLLAKAQANRKKRDGEKSRPKNKRRRWRLGGIT